MKLLHACVLAFAWNLGVAELAFGECGQPPAPIPGSWCSVDGTHVRIWWKKPWFFGFFGSDEQKATRIRDDVERVVWPRFEEVLRRVPVPDGDRRYRQNGGDGRYDIMLVSDVSGEYGETRQVTRTVSNAPAARFSMVSRTLRDAQLLPKVAHELMHGFLSAYRCRARCTWLEEATATWAEHYAYPSSNTEQEYSKQLLQDPSQSLDSDPMANIRHKNGAYLFLLFLQYANAPTRGDPDIVRRIWEATETAPDALAAIDVTIPGGFQGVWRDFITYNWNADFATQYQKWDSLVDGVSRWKVTKSPSMAGVHGPPSEYLLDVYQTGSVSIPMQVTLPRLSAAYFVFQFDTSVRSIQFSHNTLSLASATGAELLIFTKQGSNWSRQPKWSTEDVHSFCRDVPDQRIDEMVVILGNAHLSSSQNFRSTSGPLLMTASSNSCLTAPDVGFEECVLEFPTKVSGDMTYQHKHRETWQITGSATRTSPTEVTYSYTWTADGGGSASDTSRKWNSRWTIAADHPGSTMRISLEPNQQVAKAASLTSVNLIISEVLDGRSIQHNPPPLFREFDRGKREAPLAALRIEGVAKDSNYTYQWPGLGQLGNTGLMTCRWSWPAFPNDVQEKKP